MRASETVVRNLRVLAFDQRLGGGDQNAEKEGAADTPPVARTATLEVTSQQAEMITLAKTLGNLSLVLNSVRDDEDEPEAKTLQASAPGAAGGRERHEPARSPGRHGRPRRARRARTAG